MNEELKTEIQEKTEFQKLQEKINELEISLKNQRTEFIDLIVNSKPKNEEPKEEHILTKEEYVKNIIKSIKGEN